MPRKSPRSKPVRLSAKRKEQLYSTVRRIHNAERWLRVAVVIAEAARDVEWFTEDGEDLLFKDEVAQAVPKLQEVFRLIFNHVGAELLLANSAADNPTREQQEARRLLAEK
jgi:hypothetical protein